MFRNWVLVGLVIPLCGCFGPNLVGDWEGSCEFSMSGYTQVLGLEIDIDEVKGGDISGDLSFSLALTAVLLVV